MKLMLNLRLTRTLICTFNNISTCDTGWHELEVDKNLRLTWIGGNKLMLNLRLTWTLVCTFNNISTCNTGWHELEVDMNLRLTWTGWNETDAELKVDMNLQQHVYLQHRLTWTLMWTYNFTQLYTGWPVHWYLHSTTYLLLIQAVMNISMYLEQHSYM